MSEKRKGKLEDWQEVDVFGETRLCGKMYECDSFSEGESVITSTLVSYANDFGGLYAITRSGSKYLLGKESNTKRSLTEILQEVFEGKN